MFETFILGFQLGSQAILTNACMLPLYPGMIAFLAGGADQRPTAARAWLGLWVLAGVLSMMLLVGAVLSLLSLSFSAVLSWLLPLVNLIVIGLGVLLLAGRNPFVMLSGLRAPVFHSPVLSAYSYGLLLGPMTLPCTGPVITSAFLLGTSPAALADGLWFFLAFGLGFGWPLAVLPLFALPIQRRIVGWLGQHHTLLNHLAGLLLIAVGLFNLLTEVLPQIIPNLDLPPAGWWVYWLVVTLLAVGLVWREREPHPLTPSPNGEGEP